MIVAGEASGDLHGANLIKALKQLNPELEVSGLGGPLMSQAGAQIYYNMMDLAVVGFTEVIKNLKEFKRVFKMLLEKLDSKPPDCVVLIDYPGFNLRLAREVKKRKIPVIYYISPQVWAWGRDRVKLIRKSVDRMLVIFEFEKEFYEKEGIDAVFVGHPLLDVVKPSMSVPDASSRFGLQNGKVTISLLPGSREKEVLRILPIMLKSALLIKDIYPDVQFLLQEATSVDEEIFSKFTKFYPIPLHTVRGNNYDVLNVSNIVMVCSGTATLETAIMQKPMVVLYKVSLLTSLMLRPIIQIPHISLVNVVAGKRVVPEFIQSNARPELIANEVSGLLKEKERMEKMQDELNKVKEKLGMSGASFRAAKEILDFISEPA